MARSSHAHPTTLNPQIIGLAENALQAILNRALARTGGSTCQHWMALNLTAANGGAIDRDQLIGRLTGALKIDDAAAQAAIAELTAAHLLQDQGLPASGSPIQARPATARSAPTSTRPTRGCLANFQPATWRPRAAC